jgi:hypothetical protein
MHTRQLSGNDSLFFLKLTTLVPGRTKYLFEETEVKYLVLAQRDTTIYLTNIDNNRHLFGCNDIRHNDTQHNDIQHNDTQHNDTHHNDTHHNDTHHNDTHHNDTHIMLRVANESIILNVIMLNVTVPQIYRKY